MTASTDTKPASTKSSSRRALLAGALGGIGAVAAGAMAKVSPVHAEGEAIVVGGEYTDATSRTFLENSFNNDPVIETKSAGSGVGLLGASVGSYGVRGESGSGSGVLGTSSSGYGVYGYSSTNTAINAYNGGSGEPAIRGYSPADGTAVMGTSGTIADAKPKTGVYGYANQDSASKGVWGFSGRGAGLYGQANKNGYAVRANGRIKADKVSGVKTVSAGLTSVTLNPGVKVTSSSFVLLTPRANIGSRGLWYTTNPSAGTITIHMSSSRSSNTKIGWLLLG